MLLYSCSQYIVFISRKMHNTWERVKWNLGWLRKVALCCAGQLSQWGICCAHTSCTFGFATGLCACGHQTAGLPFFAHVSALERCIMLTLLFLNPTIGRCSLLSDRPPFQVFSCLPGQHCLIKWLSNRNTLYKTCNSSPINSQPCVLLHLWCCLQCAWNAFYFF